MTTECKIDGRSTTGLVMLSWRRHAAWRHLDHASALWFVVTMYCVRVNTSAGCVLPTHLQLTALLYKFYEIYGEFEVIQWT